MYLIIWIFRAHEYFVPSLLSLLSFCRLTSDVLCRPKDMQTELKVSVHLSAEKKETVIVSGQGDVFEVKKAISQKTGKAPHSFYVVFSGKILDEKSELKVIKK